MNVCQECRASFEITPAEKQIAQKVFAPEFPIPEFRKCPPCRMRQRLAFRNERNLYRRKCAVSGKSIVSVYRPDSPVVVYDQSVWWGDSYEPRAYGQEFDFTRPFFEQFAELHARVPKLSIHNSKSENCEFTNYSAQNRNCYLAVGALGARDCLYCYRVFHSNDVVDSFGLSNCELCYECLQGSELTNCVFAMNCQSSSDLTLCEDCIGCHDCFGCVNLRNSRNCIFNEQFTSEEYDNRVAALEANFFSARAQFERFRAGLPVRSTYSVNCEDSFGDQIRNCRRCEDVYFVYDSEDMVHCRNGDSDRDCADLNFGDDCELQFNASNLQENYRVAFAALAWYTSESFYVLSCFNSKKLFGCCGMKKHEYCILNRQYSVEEYEQMIRKIAAHMVETGEWGAFFPPSISPFLFSESVGAELFPLSAAEYEDRGYNGGDLPVIPVAQTAGPVPECAACGKRYRMVSQEESFYAKMGLPAPSECPDCRHKKRMQRRRPMALTRINCASCNKSVPSSAPTQTVLCEECYGKLSGA